MKIDKLSKAISAAEEDLDEIDRVIDPLAVETQAALGRVTADLLSGVIDDAKAAKLREQAELELERMRERRETLMTGLPGLRERLASEEETERVRQVEKQRVELRQSAHTRDRAQKKFVTDVRDTLAAGRELQRRRELVEADVQTIGAMLQPGEGLGVDIDEPAFGPEAEALREVLAVPPQRPAAERQTRRDEASQQQQLQDEESLSWFRQRPSPMRLAQVPAHLRHEAETILREYQAKDEVEQQRLKEQAASREVLRV